MNQPGHCPPGFLPPLPQALPFPVGIAADDHGVPEGVQLGTVVVHDPGQPGVNGLWAVTVPIAQKILVNPARHGGPAETQLSKATN